MRFTYTYTFELRNGWVAQKQNGSQNKVMNKLIRLSEFSFYNSSLNRHQNECFKQYENCMEIIIINDQKQ